MSFLPWIGIVVIVLTSVLLLRRVQTNMLLLFSGLLMIFIAVGFGVTDFLPKGAKSTGFIGFDVFELMRQISVKQISGIGLLIMTAGGFAGYMDKIGAARALVKVCTEPLKNLRSPYLVLMMAYLVGQFLCPRFVKQKFLIRANGCFHILIRHIFANRRVRFRILSGQFTQELTS